MYIDNVKILNTLREYKNFSTLADFARYLNVKPQVLSNWYARNTFDIHILSDTFPEVDGNWLITGKGNMLKNNNDIITAQAANTQQAEPATGLKQIPLVTLKAAAGFGNDNFTIKEADVKEYYIVPKFRYNQVDFMIELSGSSMYPKYNSGDVVACTILRDGAFIQWNKCHVIATRDQGLLCKRLMPGDTPDTLKMISDNTNYPPFDVPKSEITGIALIVGVIRLE